MQLGIWSVYIITIGRGEAEFIHSFVFKRYAVVVMQRYLQVTSCLSFLSFSSSSFFRGGGSLLTTSDLCDNFVVFIGFLTLIYRILFLSVVRTPSHFMTW